MLSLPAPRLRWSPSALALHRLDSSAIDEGITACLGLCNIASWQHAAREPDIPANSRTLANGNPAENRRAGIDHDIVFNDRVPGASLTNAPLSSSANRLAPSVTA